MENNITLNFLKGEQKACINRNLEQVKNYFLKKIESSKKDTEEFKFEKEILFLSKYSVSSKFIAKYFNITEDYIKKIATKHNCYSNLLLNFTENENARCFSRHQILKSCEEFNYICPMCFKTLDITNTKTLTGHHIQPFALGGKTLRDNCLPLHVKCHFHDFKLLHSALFNSENPIYSAKYFNDLKYKLSKEESGVSSILNEKIYKNK